MNLPMNPGGSPLRAITAAVVLALPSFAFADNTLQELSQKIDVLAQVNQQQEMHIQDLERRLTALTRAAPVAAAPAVPSPLQVKSDAVSAATQASSTPQGSVTGNVSSQLPVVSEIPKSVEDIYQEAGGFASGKFSIEPGFTYTHYDTRELMLNGFLALDSIFLGNIHLDRVRSDSMTFDLTARYSPSPRWQLDVNMPWIARDATYFSGGAGGAAGTVSQGKVNQGPKLGDVSFGAGYKVVEETTTLPDIIWSVRAKAPTGSRPYGIKLIQPDPNNNNLSIPQSLPTGNGVWGLTTGLSFVKTVDPAVLFANLGYTHYLSKSFNDISSTLGTVTPGDVQLGDSWSWGAGFAFALNDKLSLGMSYSQQMSKQAQIRQQGAPWTKVVGSDANAANLNIGLTYAVSKRLSIIPNLSVGMTPDTANYAFSIKFPYRY